MIDKIKVGKYLKQLRLNKKREKDGKPFSQDDLANEFCNKGIIISVNAVAEWEKGLSLPSFDNLKVLSEIYNRTLDELLDGEDLVEVDYIKKYFIANPNWHVEYGDIDNLYQIRNEQILLVTNRFKELIVTRIHRSFTTNEENEFRFLFVKFYELTDYANKYINLDANDSYLRFKYALNELLVKIKDMTEKEKYWEVQKLYYEKSIIHFRYFSDVPDLKVVPILQQRFKNMENWQKDMFLAMFQNIKAFYDNPDKYGSKYLKMYEDKNGEYNYELEVKKDIKELVNRGACINKYLLNSKKEYYASKRIVDRIQELYDLCVKPITMNIIKNGKVYSYLIENNPKNRFIINYYYSLRYQIKGIGYKDDSYDDIDELYEWFSNADTISDEMYLVVAKANNIDINQDKKYWMIDVKKGTLIDHYFNEFKEKEKKIALGLKELDELEERLNKGEKEYYIKKIDIIGGHNEDTIREHIKYWLCNIDYSTYLKWRDKKLTTELLDDLDVLSLDEIKNKYFAMEVIKDE